MMALPVVTAIPPSRSGQPTSTVPEIRIKEERPDDAEINAIAARMLEQNRAKMAEAAAQASHITGSNAHRHGGQQCITSYLNRGGGAQQGGVTNGSESDEKPLDITSQKGKFGWVTLGCEHIPYIVRAGDKYCSVRMVEQKLLNKYLSYLSSDIFSCTCIRSYYITECEAKLLTDVNIKHCEGMFGKEPFTTKDLVVLLDDANEFYQFLDLCYNKLLHPLSEVNHDRCGFVRINKDSVVPYTVKDNNRYVPLFYFEGETDTLKKNSAVLGPWDLAYLKFCCKVQGIRSELFANDSCQVISLGDIKSFFPPGTVFDEYWPPKVVDAQLLVSAKNSIRHTHSSWIKAPPTPSPVAVSATAVIPTDPVASVLPMTPAANPINGWQTMSNRYPHTANAVSNRMAAQQQARMQQVQQMHQNAVTPSAPTHVVRSFNRNLPTYYQNMNSGTHQNLPASVHNQPHARPNATANARYYTGTTEVIDLSSPPHSPQQQRALMMNGAQQAIGAGRPSQHVQHNKNEVVTWKNLIQIMETPARDTTNFPFKMQKALVSDKMVPCINAKPYLYSELLMTVNDLMDEFFPSVSMHKCKEVLQNVLQVNLYAGNLQQKTVLRDQGKCKSLNEVLPLIQLKDVLQYMPQLKYVMRSPANNDQQQQAQKRQRLS